GHVARLLPHETLAPRRQAIPDDRALRLLRKVLEELGELRDAEHLGGQRHLGCPAASTAAARHQATIGGWRCRPEVGASVQSASSTSASRRVPRGPHTPPMLWRAPRARAPRGASPAARTPPRCCRAAPDTSRGSCPA